jgi:hypothetical protein
MKLFAPESYYQAEEKEKDRVCNGCGAKGLGGWLVPNTLYFLSIKEACNIHDWMYEQGKTNTDKEEADRVFLNNMLRIIEGKPSKLLNALRRQRAMKYYTAVKDYGGPAFWNCKNNVINHLLRWV